MSISAIKNILTLHGINYSEENNRILAEENYTFEGSLYTDLVDVTDWSRKEILIWLGY